MAFAPIDRPKNLDVLLKGYSEEWVALDKDENKVLGHGKTMAEAIKEANRRGCSEPILTYVPSHYGAYVL